MTDLAFNKVACAVCGKICSVTVILSTNELGSPDLDTRPAEMARSAIKSLVQVCTGCTYCSADLSKIEPELAPLVYSPAYRAIFSEPCFSPNASYWRCKAYLEAKSGKYADAFWSTMNAAWDCDDHEIERTSLKSRKEAIEFYHLAEKRGRVLTESPESDTLILMDLTRRMGDHENFERTVKKYGKDLQDPLYKKVRDFQSYLMQCFDTGPYTLDDAVAYCDYRSMYILNVADKDLEAVVNQGRMKNHRAYEEIAAGDILLLKNRSQITHYAVMKGMAIIDTHWPVPKDLIYGHVITLTQITVIKPPLHLWMVLPDDAPTQYLYFDTCKKMDRQDQKLIEDYLNLS